MHVPARTETATGCRIMEYQRFTWELAHELLHKHMLTTIAGGMM